MENTNSQTAVQGNAAQGIDQFFAGMAEMISKCAGIPVTTSDLETPPDRKMGDIAFPCFRLSKTARKAPQVLAQEISTACLSSGSPLLTDFHVDAAGPYVNFSLKANSAFTLVRDLSSAKSAPAELPAKSREKWVFEFSSPNVAKPFQIYHLRTTIVGAALSRMAKLRGFDVIRINHLGDWGTQYGKLAVALERYASTLGAELTLADLVRVYVQIHKDIETDPSIEVEGQARFALLEKGDPGMTAIWKKCVDVSLREFEKVYSRFNVKFDHYWGESFYQEQLAPLISKLRESGVLVESEGALVVPVQTRDGKEIPPCILQKKDGASIYATRDVAAAIYRADKFHFDRMTYIVGKEQILHFEQVFGVLRAMGLSWEKACEHLPLGMYRFGGGKMSTRKGNFVTLDEVLEMCREKSLNLMRTRVGTETTLTEAEITAIAEDVSVGALVFADLSTDPTKDLDFDVDRVISFEGETGPYLQYAHTRCQSILRKAADWLKDKDVLIADGGTLLQTDAEVFLMKQILRFGIFVERSLQMRKPSVLAGYLVDLVHDFNFFYRECHVIQEDQKELTRARLVLVQSTQKILSSGLDLLGIPKPNRM